MESGSKRRWSRDRTHPSAAPAPLVGQYKAEVGAGRVLSLTLAAAPTRDCPDAVSRTTMAPV